MCEMANICWKMTEMFDKRLKYVGNDLQIWDIAKTFVKWLRYMVQGLSSRETA